MSSDYYSAQAGELERAFLTWENEWARRERDTSYHDDLRAAFMAGAAAERGQLSPYIRFAAARLRDMATELDGKPWPGREHLAGFSYRAVCWCQISHTAEQANVLNGDAR